MKRSSLIAAVTFALAITTATSAQACCYIPWLDPLAWLGFYGCGSGCGYGYGYGGYAPGCCYGGGYARPAYGAYPQPVYGGYAPPVPMAHYSSAPTTACGCTDPAAQVQAMSAYRVPVTSYRPVTQYVPQTSYRTEYRYAPPQASLAYGTPVMQGSGLPMTSYGNPSYPVVTDGSGFTPGTLPSTTYYDPSGTPMNSIPGLQAAPSVATPIPAGDIGGDHEYPSQSYLAPVFPNSQTGAMPIRKASYGVTPRSARSYSSVVR